MATAAVAMQPDAPKSTSGALAECPKCAHKVEDFLVDTNCTFKMCSNLDCTWPFDSQNMGQYFEYDHSVPSIRKRSKKRKAMIAKDERRHHKRVATHAKTTVAGTSRAVHGSLPPPLPLATPVAAGASSKTLVPPLADLGGLGQLPDWLASICGDVAGRSTLDNSSLRPLPLAAVHDDNAIGTSGLLLAQGKYEQQQRNSNCDDEASGLAGAASPCALGTCDKSSYNSSGTSEENPEWLDKLLSSVTSESSSTLTLPPPPPLSGADSLLLNGNVDDILAALNSPPPSAVPSTRSSSATEDAVIPRASRQPSPTTSNSESGADDIDTQSPLTPGELASLIGNDKEISRMLSQTAASSTPFDPLSVLLSPPGTAAATAPAGDGGSAAPLDLSDLYWPQTEGAPTTSSVVPGGASGAGQVAFDFGDLFNVPTPTTATAPTASALAGSVSASASAGAASAVSSIDASIIENLFGPTPSSKITSNVL
ncbi:hypothetical protein GQ54DRAFT_22872 [Martensiomyces pterosporus]|nr:hypothetical protein GQ54DRAFT_22872 [Martensiomyces pterosporus]